MKMSPDQERILETFVQIYELKNDCNPAESEPMLEFISTIKDINQVFDMSSILENLSNNGVTMYRKDITKLTLLEYAVTFCNVPAVDLLVNNGADINHQNACTGYTALHALMDRINDHSFALTILNYFLVKNETVYTHNQIVNTNSLFEGMSPLALYLKNIPEKSFSLNNVTRIFLEGGSEIYYAKEDSCSPISMASSRFSRKFTEFVFENYQGSLDINDNDDLIEFYAEHDLLSQLNGVLDDEETTNSLGSLSRTLDMIAFRYPAGYLGTEFNSSKTILKLIKLGAKIDKIDAVFIASVIESNPELARYALENGANANKPQVNSKGEACYAGHYLSFCKEGSYEVLEILIQNGLDINLLNSSSNTILKYSLSNYYGYYEHARLLLSNGANIAQGIIKFIKERQGDNYAFQDPRVMQLFNSCTLFDKLISGEGLSKDSSSLNLLKEDLDDIIIERFNASIGSLGISGSIDNMLGVIDSYEGVFSNNTLSILKETYTNVIEESQKILEVEKAALISLLIEGEAGALTNQPLSALLGFLEKTKGVKITLEEIRNATYETDVLSLDQIELLNFYSQNPEYINNNGQFIIDIIENNKSALKEYFAEDKDFVVKLEYIRDNVVYTEVRESINTALNHFQQKEEQVPTLGDSD